MLKYIIPVVIILGIIIAMFVVKEKVVTSQENLDLNLKKFKSKLYEAYTASNCKIEDMELRSLRDTYSSLKTEYDVINSSMFKDQEKIAQSLALLTSVETIIADIMALPTCDSKCLPDAVYDKATGSCKCPTGSWGVNTDMGVFCYQVDCSRIPNSQYNPVNKTCECKPGYVFNDDKTQCVTCSSLLPNSSLDPLTNSCICNPGYIFKDNICKSITELNSETLNQINANLATLESNLNSYNKSDPALNIESNSMYVHPTFPTTKSYLPYYMDRCIIKTEEPDLTVKNVDECANQNGGRYFAIGQPTEAGYPCKINGLTSDYLKDPDSSCITNGMNPMGSNSLVIYKTNVPFYYINEVEQCDPGWRREPSDIIRIEPSQGSRPTAIIREDNRAWGEDNTRIDAYMPFKWYKIVNGPSHTMGITIERRMIGFGDNSLGQLGMNYSDKPYVQLYSLWEDIACLDGATVGIKLDGSLWVWGYSEVLGVNSPSPVRVGTENTYSKVFAVGNTVYLLKTDGILSIMTNINSIIPYEGQWTMATSGYGLNKESLVSLSTGEIIDDSPNLSNLYSIGSSIVYLSEGRVKLYNGTEIVEPQALADSKLLVAKGNVGYVVKVNKQIVRFTIDENNAITIEYIPNLVLICKK